LNQTLDCKNAVGIEYGQNQQATPKTPPNRERGLLPFFFFYLYIIPNGIFVEYIKIIDGPQVKNNAEGIEYR
jgi:hypothetical protein